MNLRLAPKSEQPKGGYMHPGHLLAYGPTHRRWTAGSGWQESDRYCVSPSSAIYDGRLLRA